MKWLWRLLKIGLTLAVLAAVGGAIAIGAAYYGLQWWLDRQPLPVTVDRPRLRRDATGTAYPPLGRSTRWWPS